MKDDDLTANELARQPYADADVMTVAVLSQLAGFASNPMIALDHPPDHLSKVATARVIDGLRHLTGEAKP